VACNTPSQETDSVCANALRVLEPQHRKAGGVNNESRQDHPAPIVNSVPPAPAPSFTFGETSPPKTAPRIGRCELALRLSSSRTVAANNRDATVASSLTFDLRGASRWRCRPAGVCRRHCEIKISRTGAFLAGALGNIVIDIAEQIRKLLGFPVPSSDSGRTSNTLSAPARPAPLKLSGTVIADRTEHIGRDNTVGVCRLCSGWSANCAESQATTPRPGWRIHRTRRRVAVSRRRRLSPQPQSLCPEWCGLPSGSVRRRHVAVGQIVFLITELGRVADKRSVILCQ